MNLIKEKEDMVKDNNSKNLVKTKNYFLTFIENVKKLTPSDNIKKRIISSIILIPIAINAIFYSKTTFFLLVVAITILMTMEWLDITKTARNKKKWRIIGFFYILIPIFCVIKIRMIEPYILLWMFVIIWATDIFAFFAGKYIGGPKLAPTISPNKTWSGLFGGMIASSLVGLISSILFPGSILFFVLTSFLLSIIEQISDLMESKVKRIFKVKDSGNIIPGHGGIIDRLDGMTLVAPVILFLITFFPNNFFA